MMKLEVCSALKSIISAEMFNVNLRALSCMTGFDETHKKYQKVKTKQKTASFDES